MELLSNIRSEEQLNEASNLIQSLSIKFAASATLSKKNNVINDGETTFFGEAPSKVSDQSRFRRRYEMKSRFKSHFEVQSKRKKKRKI